MTENYKPITKYITLKVTYNSYYVESPETWDWNQLIEAKEGESIEIIIVSDIPIAKRKIF